MEGEAILKLQKSSFDSGSINGQIPQFQPMPGRLNGAVKKNRIGRSANWRVYGCGIDHEDAIWISNYSYGDLQHIFWGSENLNFMQSNFFLQK